MVGFRQVELHALRLEASKDNPFAEKMVALDGYIRGTDWIDFTKPAAAKLYWDTIVSDILSTGIDSWWFDATEPEKTCTTATSRSDAATNTATSTRSS